VISINRRDTTLKAFRDTSAGWMLLVSTILSAFAGTIAFGVVYNTARINLAERERELASLRVLGFTIGEITTIFAGELVTLVLIGIPVGFLLARGLITVVLQLLASEAYRFPDTMQAGSMAIATVVVSVSALASALLVRRRLDQLDLVGVLKTRD
jgi:putative ABC transport system permease protein